MNLHEEYTKRHKLSCPVVKRPDKSAYLICRTNKETWGSNWSVFNSCIRAEANKPSYYQFNWYSIRHNGLLGSGGALQPMGQPIKVEWDEYEVASIRLAKSTVHCYPVSGLAEASLVAWEIFLFCSDDKIREYPSSVRTQIYKSLDTELSIEDRLLNQSFVIKWLYENGNGMLSKWEQIKQYCDPKNYAGWLAEMFQQMRDDQGYSADFCDLQSMA